MGCILQHFELKAVSGLSAHPQNVLAFGDLDGELNDDPSFVESIRQHGITTPLLVTDGGLILSGHRRWAAAKRVGLQYVPCVVVPSDNEDNDELWAAANRQRQMTEEQRARWMKACLAIESESAARRQRSGRSLDLTDNCPQGRNMTAADKVGQMAGVSGKTVTRSVQTVDVIDELESHGQKDAANEIREALETRSVNAAYKLARAVTSPDPAHFDESTDCRTFMPAEVRKFRDAHSVICRMIDRAKDPLEQICWKDHAELMSTVQRFAKRWQELLPEQDWFG